MKNNILFVMALLLLAACVERDKERDVTYSGAYLGQKAPGLIPEMFAPGFISTSLNEGTCTFSPDGKECFFHIVYNRGHDLVVSIANSREVEGVWTEPGLIYFSGTKYLDMYPFLSYDGETLYFQSNRPVNDTADAGSFNIWTSKVKDNKWSDPVPLMNMFGDSAEVSGISVANSGNIYYTLITEDIQEIYRIRNHDGELLGPERLPNTVNSVSSQFDGVIAPDESYMILCVYGKEDSFGSTDMYVTFRDEDDQWSEVVNLGKAFNTENVDGPATISADGKYVFFNGYLSANNWNKDTLCYTDITDFYTKPGSGNSDVYWVDAKAIQELRNE